MNDKFGNHLSVGDYITYPTNSQVSQLEKAEVIGFCVDYVHLKSDSNPKFRKAPHKVAKLFKQKPVFLAGG